MEWDPNERDASERDSWVSDAQRWIGQIKGVLQCKIDLDDTGEITGVHVVAGMERDPRHIVRDVEGLLKARLDVDVYYKKIGVVQVLENGPLSESTAPVGTPVGTPVAPEPPANAPRTSVPGSAVTFHPPTTEPDDLLDSPQAAPAQETHDDLPEPTPAVLVVEDMGSRVVCGGVGVMASETSIRAEVQLRAGDVEARGLREGPNHADSDILLVAQAAVAAVAELIADPVLLHLKEVRLQEMGGEMVILAAVDLVEGRHSTTLYGTCGTSHNRQQAVVYAVLDALNRRLALHGLKTLEGSG